MKRIICLILCILLLALTACAKGNDIDMSEYKQEVLTNGDTVELTFTVMNKPDNLTDIKLVENAINRITVEKLNVKVSIYLVAGGSMDKLDLAFAQNESIDLFFTPTLSRWVEKKQVIDIGGLLREYGQGIIGELGEEYLPLGQIDGVQYGVVSNKDFAVQEGVVMRKDIVDKYGIDVSKIRSFTDLESVFEIVKHGEPSVFCLGNMGSSYFRDIDSPESHFAAIIDCGESTEIVNKFSLPEYEQYARLLRSWNEKGYLSEEISGGDMSFTEMLRDGMIFSYFEKYKPGLETQVKRQSGVDVVCVPLANAIMRTSTATSGQWCISSTCERPDKAMQLLNLMYTDPDIMNLLCWGIEGLHYVKDGDTITYPEGVTSETSGYNSTMNWHLPNQFIAHVWEGNDPDVWEQTREFNRNAIKSTALGFSFDKTPVQQQYDEVSSICDKYSKGFSYGVFDVDEVLPLFLKELSDAGIDSVIAEMQRQFDDWRQ